MEKVKKISGTQRYTPKGFITQAYELFQHKLKWTGIYTIVSINIETEVTQCLTNH